VHATRKVPVSPTKLGGSTDLRLWASDHPVLEALWRRRKEASAPKRRTDGLRIGLAVEGGGMRGVVSAAMLSALEDFGMADVFDTVYGTSSGSINCAYFLAGKTWYPVSIYYEDLSTDQFLAFRRGITGGSMLNRSYALDDVMDKIKPLDYARVLASPVSLVVSVTDVDECRTLPARDFVSREDLKAALRASSWLPLAVKGTVDFRGHGALDGGILTGHPFALAIADDPPCTHVLSLSTRPMSPPRPRPSRFQHYVAWRLNRTRPGLVVGYLQAITQYGQDKKRLISWRTDPAGPPWVLDIAPLPGTPEVKRHELDQYKILTAAEEAYALMYCVIEGKPASALVDRKIRSMPRLTIVETL